MSKVLTLLSLAVLVAAGASCSRESSDLVVRPGASGTVIAIGASVDSSFSAGGVSFDFKKADRLSIGIASGGMQPIERRDSKWFKPASITKLVTTSLGLSSLGSDFHFTTRVFVGPVGSGMAHGLIIVADGDPQVVRRMIGKGIGQHVLFNDIAVQLKSLGISALTGTLTLVSADARHDAAVPAVGMQDSDHTTCFGAISQSFNFDWNCADSRRGMWMDQDLRFPIEVGTAVTPLFASTGRVQGFTVTRNAEAQLPISDVKPWYGRALISSLKESGIQTDGVAIADSKTIPSGMPTFSILSDPLSKIIEYTNKPSDNFLADAIFKTIASRRGGEGSDLRAEGESAVADFVLSTLKAAGHAEYADEIHLIDGAGLSHENHVTARGYLALLGEFARQSWIPVLWNSLPIAGEDGTLKARMQGTSAVGIVRAKTGTLNGSYQLAGYIPRIGDDGRATEFVPFVILSAVDPAKRFDVFELQSKIASQLLKTVNAPRNVN